MALKVGDKIPEILGYDQTGKELKREDFKGKKLVLYFYPKDNTPGCTRQACSFRDLYGEFRALGVEVISRPVASVENDLVRHNPGHLARELMALHAERNMRLVEPSTPGHTRNKVER